ncbi:endo alpha-1,4 polygalactosaminidase [Castellaniella sp. GW247-6E4]|uniref:endo alpha-1,4 polygalactosaminidase n=1 Tax=Castellaniella sp. GW247-6E4 TaxID=3140380 RepID=UPI003314B7DD
MHRQSSPERSAFAAAMARPFPRMVFYYGALDEDRPLDGFDVAVVEPGHGFSPARHGPPGTLWLGYIGIGEVLEATPHFDAMPDEWLIGRNGTWGGKIIDQAATDWPGFLVDTIASPIWQAGYRGFFLDTMDSYLLLELSPAARDRQRQGLSRAIGSLRTAFPEAVIIVNRGFELLQALGTNIDALAFESLYQGWDEAHQRYIEVPPQDRAWLLDQASAARACDLPAISIDYCPADDFASAPALMRKIAAHGIVPCVGDKHLLTIASSAWP